MKNYFVVFLKCFLGILYRAGNSPLRTPLKAPTGTGGDDESKSSSKKKRRLNAELSVSFDLSAINTNNNTTMLIKPETCTPSESSMSLTYNDKMGMMIYPEESITSHTASVDLPYDPSLPLSSASKRKGS